MDMTTLAELADLAIGNPEAGSVNFTALYSLLQCVLDHLGIGSLKRATRGRLSGGTDPGVVSGLAERTRAPESDGVSNRALAQRLARLEERLDALDQLPGTDAILSQGRPGSAQPIRDMWQMIQLQKKTEASQDGITKAMSVLGDVLEEIRVLKETRASTLSQLEELQLSLQEVRDVAKAFADMKERMRRMDESLRGFGGSLAAIPDPKELVQWSHVAQCLHEPCRTQDWSDLDSAQHVGQQALRRVGNLSAEQESLKQGLGSLGEQVQHLTQSMASKDIPDNTTARLTRLDNELQSLKSREAQERKGLASLRETLAGLNAESASHSAAAQQLRDNCRELESRLCVLEQNRCNAHRRKSSAESAEAQLERSGQNEDPGRLSQVQQEAVSEHLRAMLQDLLPSLPTQDRESTTLLDKLSKDVERKLDRVEFAPLRQELEEGWRRLRARLKEEPDLRTETPAGFRKKLLERVACISCDKPADILTGMHLVTVQSGSSCPGSASRPAGSPRNWAGGFPRAMGGVQGRRRLPPSHTLHTLYPSMDPALQPYFREEVGLLGTDGILYRGRVELALPSLVPPCSRSGTPVLSGRG